MSQKQPWTPETSSYIRPWSRIAFISKAGKEKVTTPQATKFAHSLVRKNSGQFLEIIENFFQMILSDAGSGKIERVGKNRLETLSYCDLYKGWPSQLLESPMYQFFISQDADTAFKLSVGVEFVPPHDNQGLKVIVSLCGNSIRKRWGESRKDLSFSELKSFLNCTQKLAFELGKQLWPYVTVVMQKGLDQPIRHTDILTCEGANCPEFEIFPSTFPSPSLSIKREVNFRESKEFLTFRDSYYQQLWRSQVKSSTPDWKSHVKKMLFLPYSDPANSYGVMAFSTPEKKSQLQPLDGSLSRVLPIQRVFGITTGDFTADLYADGDPFGDFSHSAMLRFMQAF